MAKKRKKYKRRKTSSTRSRTQSTTKNKNQSRDGLELDIKPETSRGIIAVILTALALISLLSLFGAAGSFGVFWTGFIASLFGVAVYIAPVLLLVLALAVLNLQKFPTKGTTYLGFVVFIIAFVSIAHLFIDQENAFELARDGSGGGLVGFVVGYPLYLLFGTWASSVILIAMMVVSLLLFFNNSIKNLFEYFKSEEDEEDAKDKKDADAKTEKALAPKMKIIDFKTKATPKKAPEDVAVKEMDQANGKKSFGPPIETKKSADDAWQTPPLDLLDDSLDRPSSGDIKSNARIIQDTLSNFGIPVEMGDVSVGPTVTQYTLRPEAGIKLNKIVALQNDLALSLAAHPLRIEAPIPGKSVVGIEVPNVSVATVRLRELLESKDYQEMKGDLLFPLGRDVAGAPITVAIEKMPHLLIAGATGSGKSVAINSLLTSLLYQNSPADLKLILVDPKRVELSHYNDIPHLLTPVITEAKKTVNSLKWIVGEMDRRYKLLQAHGSRDIHSFNEKNKESHLPKIVLVIDELSDLMSIAAREVEASIVRLAQMARAVGIHLVVATQRPSVDVITGLIKANITSRIAFSVTSITDSRTILDTSGAEKLLGNGDMLYLSSDLAKPRRIQGAFLSEKEVEKVTNWLKGKDKPDYLEEVTQKQGSVPGVPDGEGGGDADDDLYDEAKQVVIEAGKASASYLQRRLRVGYARAARLIDLLEENGVIGPGEGAKPREILVGSEGEQEVSEAPTDDSDGFYVPSDDDAPPPSEREPDMQDMTEDQAERDRRDF